MLIKIISEFYRRSRSFSVAIGLVLFILISFAISQMKNLNAKYSMDDFFPAHHPLLIERDQIRKTFQLEEHSTFLVVLQRTQGTWLEPQTMAELQDITADLQAIPGVKSVTSLPTLETAREQVGELTVGPIYANLPQKDWVSYTKSNEILNSHFISDKLQSTLVIVEPQTININALSEFTSKISHTIKEKHPELNVSIGGSPAIQGSVSDHLFEDLKIFLILSLVSFCIVVATFFGGASAFFFTLSSLLAVNLIVIGMLAYFRIPFSILLSTLPIIVSISLISVIIHTAHRWAEIFRTHMTREQKFTLSLGVIKEMALPNFLGSLTTAIGFLTLGLTDIPLIRQYGIIVAISIMVAWLLTHLMMFGFLSYTRPILRSWTQRKSFWVLPILKQALPIFVIIIVATLTMAYTGKDITFSGRLFDDLPLHDPNRKATEQIDTHFGGVVPYEISLNSSKEGYWKEPQNLVRLKKTIGQIRGLRSVGSALSLPSFFGNKIPESRQAVGEFIFLYSMAESNPLKNYITEDGKSVHLSLRLHDLSSIDIGISRIQIKRFITQSFPDIGVQESGLAVYSHTINQEVAKSLVFNFWHSILGIGILLMLVFRSLRWALIACLPNLVPPAILIGSLAIAQTPVKPGVALIFSIALGLAFNNTVYLLSRLKRMMREKNITHLPLKSALLQEGNPCLFETLVMFFGFVIFLASDFKINQIFGIYMIISIVAGAIGDIVLLPSILQLFPALLRGKKMINSNIALPLLVFLGVGLFTQPSNSADDKEALQILKKSQQQIESRDDQASVEMKIIEANGEIKSRKIKLETLRDDSFHALVRIQTPADIKGTGFLAKVNGSEEEQWIYLPSTKQVRRIVGTKKSAGVLGSELTVEDLNSTAVKNSTVRLVKKDGSEILLEVTPKAGTSLYSKVQLSLAADTYLPQKTEYFQNDKVVKTVSFLNYKKYAQVWRAQSIQVRNLSNQRGTDLNISDIKINSGLSVNDFSINALKN